MSAVILAFPRKTPLREGEFPAYWGYDEEWNYNFAIEDKGYTHAKAFALYDAEARLPQGTVLFRFKAEDDAQWIERVERFALSPAEAQAAWEERNRPTAPRKRARAKTKPKDAAAPALDPRLEELRQKAVQCLVGGMRQHPPRKAKAKLEG